MPGCVGPVLLSPDSNEEQTLVAQAKLLGIETETFCLSDLREQPLPVSPERWQMEGDKGLGVWAGGPLAAIVEKRKWKTVIVIPLTNLLVERAAVLASLELHRREGFDATFSEDRPAGANWCILEANLLKGLQASHSDIMAARGGLAWALKKPLYPFQIGEFHCPRDHPRLPADLRLIDGRTEAVLAQTQDENFATADFSYSRWLHGSGWEEVYCSAGPKTVVVEPSNLCEGRCFACPQPFLRRERGNMSGEMFSRIAGGLQTPFDGRWVFSGMGEPFRNPRLGEIIGAVRGQPAMLVTSLSAEPTEGFPWDALSHVRVSVDAVERQSFEIVRPGCSWQRIESFLNSSASRKAAAPETQPEVGVSFLKQVRNGGQGMTFLGYWERVCTPVFRTHFFRWPMETPPDKVQWFQVLGVSDFLGQLPFSGETRFVPIKRRPCLHALLGMHVQWDGTVVACPFDHEGRWPLGHLGRATPRDIWSSENATDFRRAHLAMEFPEGSPCGTCQDWYHKA